MRSYKTLVWNKRNFNSGSFHFYTLFYICLVSFSPTLSPLLVSSSTPNISRIFRLTRIVTPNFDATKIQNKGLYRSGFGMWFLNMGVKQIGGKMSSFHLGWFDTHVSISHLGIPFRSPWPKRSPVLNFSCTKFMRYNHGQTINVTNTSNDMLSNIPWMWRLFMVSKEP